jgi:LmbE family N-acetylglucosaminyl deacetylase
VKLRIILGLAAVSLGGSQTPQSAAETNRALQRLQHTVRVLHTQAHPDDEDGALLTVLSRKHGYKTAILSLTRGEGGANLVGAEMYDALGVLRTNEFLKAASFYGTELYFTRLADFGYSKRADETLEHWAQYEPLCEVVRFIRWWKPDVVISRFHGAQRDGHGQHQMAGELTVKAFAAAADGTQCADAGPAWKASKLYLSVRPLEESTLKVETGEWDPLLGMTYREIAREGWNAHRSQAVGQQLAPRGSAMSGLLLKESRVGDDGKDLVAGIPNELPSEVRMKIDAAVAAYDPRHPEKAAVLLTEAKRALEGVAGFRAEEKRREMDEAMAKLLGLSWEALADPLRPGSGPFGSRESVGSVVPADSVGVTVTLVNRSDVPVTPREVQFVMPESWRAEGREGMLRNALGKLGQAQGKYVLVTHPQSVPTQPYWWRADPLREFAYRLRFLDDRWMPFARPEVMAKATYEVSGVPFTVETPVMTTHSRPPVGDLREELKVLPLVGVRMTPRSGMVRAGESGKVKVEVELTYQGKDPQVGLALLQMRQGGQERIWEKPVKFEREGERQTLPFEVELKPMATGEQVVLRAGLAVGKELFEKGFTMIGQPGMEPRPLFEEATAKVTAMDVKVKPGLKVGYVTGVGDATAAALEQLGVRVERLGAAALSSADLSQYAAIVVGIRAYAVRLDLRAANPRLLEYATQGGHLVVQYQTQEYDAAAYGPYPFQLTPRAEETSEEAAKVTLLAPDHALLQSPNRITEADFEGWVEERGSKFMMRFDERYTPLVETHDRNDPEQKGVLLHAKVGNGTFTYCALALYRQLPAGVAGAYRLLANLVSQ